MATIDAIIRAVKIINSDAKLSISGNDLNSIIWEDGTSAISKSNNSGSHHGHPAITLEAAMDGPQ